MAAPSSRTIAAILLPGGVLPAELAYGALLSALGDDVRAIAKDLEVYAGDRPPARYRVDHEMAGILRTADEAGFDRFHLVGYSGGGAASLAFAAEHPDRLLSLALLEPAWSGNHGLSSEERALWEEFDRVMQLPPEERMAAFVRLQLRPGVALPEPPPGPPPPWMRKRPAGLAALVEAFKAHELPESALRGFGPPVLYVLGGLSNPDAYERPAHRLAGLFPDFTLEVFGERHHFDPPHRVEPERLARVLRQLWDRS